MEDTDSQSSIPSYLVSQCPFPFAAVNELHPRDQENEFDELDEIVDDLRAVLENLVEYLSAKRGATLG